MVQPRAEWGCLGTASLDNALMVQLESLLRNYHTWEGVNLTCSISHNVAQAQPQGLGTLIRRRCYCSKKCPLLE